MTLGRPSIQIIGIISMIIVRYSSSTRLVGSFTHGVWSRLSIWLKTMAHMSCLRGSLSDARRLCISPLVQEAAKTDYGGNAENVIDSTRRQALQAKLTYCWLVVRIRWFVHLRSLETLSDDLPIGGMFCGIQATSASFCTRDTQFIWRFALPFCPSPER